MKKQLLLISMLLAFAGSKQANAQIIGTAAGTGSGAFMGDGGLATSAMLYIPYAVATDPSGNLYITDGFNQRIRKVTKATGIITTIAGTGSAGSLGDGGLATSAQLNYPNGICLDASGNIYISDVNNSKIRKITASTGMMSTVAGGGSTLGDGGLATNAQLSNTWAVTTDQAGNIYIVDNGHARIRKVTVSTGIITTVAGNGTYGCSGDGGLATSAQVGPTGVAVDAAGNIYITDSGGNVIRKVDASTGIITTIVGDGTAGSIGDGGPALSAELNAPWGILLDGANNIYISDQGNRKIRRVNAATGVISHIAGTGVYGYSGDGGAAISGQISTPNGMAIDAFGNLFFGDVNNNVIRKVSTITGIDEIASSQAIAIYPNPSNGKFQVDADMLDLAKDYQVEVYNALGQMVLQQNNNNEIDINTAPKGIYFVKIYEGTKIFNARVVVE